MNSGLSPCLPKHVGRCSAPLHHRPAALLLQRGASGDQRQWERYLVHTATDCQASGRCPSMHPALPRNPGRIPQAPRTRPMVHESIADSPSKINPRLLVQNPVLHQRLWKSWTFGAKPVSKKEMPSSEARILKERWSYCRRRSYSSFLCFRRFSLLMNAIQTR